MIMTQSDGEENRKDQHTDIQKAVSNLTKYIEHSSLMIT